MLTCHNNFPKSKTTKKALWPSIFLLAGLLFLFLNNATYYYYYFDNLGTVFTVVGLLFLMVFVLFGGRVTFLKNGSFWALSLLLIVSFVAPSLFSGFSRELILKLVYFLSLIVAISTAKARNYDVAGIILTISKIFLIWCLVSYVLDLTVFDKIPLYGTSNKLMYNWYPVECRGLLFFKNFSHVSLGNYSITRLCAPFGEPGIAQLYFNYGLLYCLFLREPKKNVVWAVLFSLGVLLGMSFIGIIVFSLIIIMFLIYKKHFVVSLFGLLLSIFIVVVLFSEKRTTFSYVDRTADYSFMTELIFDYLPFGTGIGNLNTINTNIVDGYGVQSVGFYCGLLLPLLLCGVFGVVYYVFLFNSFVFFSKNKFVNFVFACFILLSLLTEPQNFEFFVMCFVISGLCNYCCASRHSKSGRVFVAALNHI